MDVNVTNNNIFNRHNVIKKLIKLRIKLMYDIKNVVFLFS